jgi:hypothetical protein
VGGPHQKQCAAGHMQGQWSGVREWLGVARRQHDLCGSVQGRVASAIREQGNSDEWATIERKEWLVGGPEMGVHPMRQ